MRHKRCMLGMLFVCLAAAGPRGAAAAPAPARVEVSGGVLFVQPLVSAESLQVTVTGPNGFAVSRIFARGETPLVALGDNGVPADGTYFYEVRLDTAAPRVRAEAEAGGASTPPVASLVHWGHVNVS